MTRGAHIPRLSTAEVVGRRLARHHLTAPVGTDAIDDLTADLCGIHAQVMSCAELSAGIRLRDGTRQVLRDALWERRSLIKTYGLRGTIHIFPAREIDLWLAALKARRDPQGQTQRDRTGLEPKEMSAAVDAIHDALDGQRLTREELGTEVARRVGDWALHDGLPAFGGRFPRWSPALARAALEGVVCFGPNDGNRVTLVRLDQWVRPTRRQDGADAQREVLRRYIRAYGPVTTAEFAQWFYMAAPDARALVESIRDELAEVELAFDDRRRFVMADDLPWDAPSAATVHLLSQFDIYCVGGHPRDLVAPPEVVARTRIERGRQENVRALLVGPLAVLLVDGVIGGVWSRKKASGGRLEVRVEPYRSLTTGQRGELEKRAERVAAILESKLDFSIGAIEARPHL